MDFCHLQELSAKTVSKKVACKTAEKFMKLKSLPNTNSRNFEEIVILLEAKHKIQNDLRLLLFL